MSKSILEEALLEAQQLDKSMKANAKEILSSTMKEEINELVKESLNEGDYVKEQEQEEEVDVLDIELDIEGDEPELELDVEDLELDMEDETEDEESFELPPLDLTLASDEEVLKVFKAMGSEDGIIIQKDDEEIEIKDENTDAEYIIKLEEETAETEEDEVELVNDEVVYEIELSEEEDVVGVDAPESEEGEEELDKDLKEEDDYGMNKGDEPKADRTKKGHYGRGPKELETAKEEGEGDYTEEEMKEASRTLGFGRKSGGKHVPKGHRKAISNNRNLGESRLRKSYNLLKEEVETLKVKNSDYKKALVTFKDKLNEVGVFNSNLAYVTRIFTEHSTTKQEKINILRRFDNVETLKGSKELYKVIKEELHQGVAKKTETISESVERKITKSSPTSGGKLLETKVYENPQFSRMKDLMSKLK